MCKAPKPPKPRDPDEDKPEWLRNPYLDGAMGKANVVNSLRTGRSSLRIDLGSDQNPGLAIKPPSQPGTSTPAPQIGNPRARTGGGRLPRIQYQER